MVRGVLIFNLWGDLYKTQVIEIAKFLNLPEEMIVKSPSAGLWKGQPDEKDLGFSYKELDKILFGLEKKLDITSYIAKAINVKQIAVERIKKCVLRVIIRDVLL